MELLDKIKNYNVKYKDDKPYFDIDGFIFFYYVLNNKNELFAICLNKPLIRLSDVKVINKQIKDFAKVSIDNIAFKNDLLYSLISIPIKVPLRRIHPYYFYSKN